MYQVLGHVAVERETNRDLLSTQQQSVNIGVVYETDDEAEARQIVAAGGYIDNETNQWIVAAQYRQVDTSVPLKEGFQELPPLTHEKPVDADHVRRAAEYPGSQFTQTPRKILP